MAFKQRRHRTMWRRVLEVKDIPPGTELFVPEGLQVGSPFRVLTAHAPVRSADDGRLLGAFTPSTLREFVRVFVERMRRGEGAPKLDFNHEPDKGLHGVVVGAFVAEPDERDEGLYVVPAWTPRGGEFVGGHEFSTPSGEKSSILYCSPEFVTGPTFARSGGSPDELGDYLGHAELLAVALTGTPQQSEILIDPVRLSRTSPRGGGAPVATKKQKFAVGDDLDAHDPVTDPVTDDGAALAARVDGIEIGLSELKSIVAKISEDVTKIGQTQSEQAERIAGDAEDEIGVVIDDVTEEAIAQVEAAAAAAVAELEDAELKLLEDSISSAEAGALSGRRRGVKRFSALIAKASRAREIRGARETRKLSAQVAQLERVNLDARRERDLAELRHMGLPKAKEDSARMLWNIEHDPAHATTRQAYSTAKTKTPWNELVDDLKAGAYRRQVPLGVVGQRGDFAGTQAPTFGAWCAAKNITKEQLVKDPSLDRRMLNEFVAQYGYAALNIEEGE